MIFNSGIESISIAWFVFRTRWFSINAPFKYKMQRIKIDVSVSVPTSTGFLKPRQQSRMICTDKEDLVSFSNFDCIIISEIHIRIFISSQLQYLISRPHLDCMLLSSKIKKNRPRKESLIRHLRNSVVSVTMESRISTFFILSRESKDRLLHPLAKLKFETDQKRTSSYPSIPKIVTSSEVLVGSVPTIWSMASINKN